MSNVVRHVLGVVAGILLPPLIAVGLIYGTTEMLINFRDLIISWTGFGALAGSGILFAVLVSSRLSPVASLLGGLGFLALGGLPLVELWGTRLLPDALTRGTLSTGFLTLGYAGIFLFLAVVLLVASVFPSRWRSAGPVVVTPGYGPPPVGAPGQGAPPPYYSPAPEDVTRPMHRE
ncbi:hypothetical protein [Nocardia aurea]|uniref:hypothetical protein n=1 Tax=Nocardia aurea TaxID=2144174 RepID=UPI000D68F30F|nr:hypothetical protein [Nocardia aurea]